MFSHKGAGVQISGGDIHVAVYSGQKGYTDCETASSHLPPFFSFWAANRSTVFFLNGWSFSVLVFLTCDKLQTYIRNMSARGVDEIRISDRSHGRILSSSNNGSDRCQKLKDSRPLYDKPPLPGKYLQSNRMSQTGQNTKCLDTFLNLSTIPKASNAVHGAMTLSAMRTVPGTLRGTQSQTVRIHPDFENLHAFIQREREFARSRDPACKYPWIGLAPQSDSWPREATTVMSTSSTSAVNPVVQPMCNFEAWEAQMERDLSLSKRRSVAGHAAAAAATAAAHRNPMVKRDAHSRR